MYTGYEWKNIDELVREAYDHPRNKLANELAKRLEEMVRYEHVEGSVQVPSGCEENPGRYQKKFDEMNHLVV